MLGHVTAEEHKAYCRLHGIIPNGPLVAKCEVRTGPHPQGYRPELPMYSPLSAYYGKHFTSGQPKLSALPKAWLKCTPEERVRNQQRALTYIEKSA